MFDFLWWDNEVILNLEIPSYPSKSYLKAHLWKLYFWKLCLWKLYLWKLCLWKLCLWKLHLRKLSQKALSLKALSMKALSLKALSEISVSESSISESSISESSIYESSVSESSISSLKTLYLKAYFCKLSCTCMSSVVLAVVLVHKKTKIFIFSSIFLFWSGGVDHGWLVFTVMQLTVCLLADVDKNQDTPSVYTFLCFRQWENLFTMWEAFHCQLWWKLRQFWRMRLSLDEGLSPQEWVALLFCRFVSVCSSGYLL